MSETSSVGEDGTASSSSEKISKGSSCGDNNSNSAKKFGAVVYEEVFDENSQPTHDEILEYAAKIGIDVIKEPHLLDIAKEGIFAQLPSHWKPCWDETINDFYYFNIETGETQWCHPLDDYFKQKVILARQGAPVQIFKASNDLSCEDASDIPEEKDSPDEQTNPDEMALQKSAKLAPLEPIGKGPNISLKKSLPPLKGGLKSGKESLSELSGKQKSLSVSSDLSPSKVTSHQAHGSEVSNTNAKQKSLQLKLSGTSFLKSSEEKEDSEISKLSPRKSILKTTLSPKKSLSTGSRANLMAKDEKKIQFDLNENLAFESESDKSSSETSSKIISSRDIKRASSSLLLQSNTRKNLLESSNLVMDPEDLIPTEPKPLDCSENGNKQVEVVANSGLSKVLSKSQSTDSEKSQKNQYEDANISIEISKADKQKEDGKKTNSTGLDDLSNSEEIFSPPLGGQPMNPKKSSRNLSKTLSYLEKSGQTKKVLEQVQVGLEALDSADESFVRPDDVLQTVKFGEDVLQQMRAKRTEILTSHGVGQKPAEPKVVKLSTKEKVLLPSSKVDTKTKDYEEQLSKVVSEFDCKLDNLQADINELMMVQKVEIEKKMKEIVTTETGQLREEFRLERELQEKKLHDLVSEEMFNLRKSLESDFEKQKMSLLEALNNQMTRSLSQVCEGHKADAASPRKSSKDYQNELDDFRNEMKHQMLNNISDLKDELMMTFKEQEKEMLKVMFKAKTGIDAPTGTSRSKPFQSDFAKELEGIEDDLKELRAMVTSGGDQKNYSLSGSTLDSDTSEGFIEITRPNHHRSRRSKTHQGSGYNLNSDADSMYESSSGDVNNASFQNLQDRVNFLERSLAPFAAPITKAFGQIQENPYQHQSSDPFFDPVGLTMSMARAGSATIHTATPQTILNMSTNFMRPNHSVWTVEDQIFKSKMWLKQRNQTALPKP